MSKPRFQVAPGESLDSTMRRYGAYDAADTQSRELVNWSARSLSADAAIIPAKEKSSARAKDIVRNNGYAQRALQIRIDNLIGHNFKLSYRPNWRALGVDPQSAAAKDFVADVEAIWTDYANDPSCPLDVEGSRTFVQIIRAGCYDEFIHGEILNSAEYIKNRRGLRTAIKIINPERLCNPNLEPDSQVLRAGVRKNSRGAAIAYYIRHRHPSDARFGMDNLFSWKPVRKTNSWGRQQIIHLFDAWEDGQTRGITKLAPILERFKMLDQWQKVKLQSDVINAMYAMVIESEFDTTTALEAIGADFNNTETNVLLSYMSATEAYHKGANITFDGAKIPHLFPNEKLNMLGKEGQGDAQLEDRLLRYISAGGNFSYEQLSSNWSQTNFSSAKASLGEAWRYFLGEQITHKRHASLIFSLVLEEIINEGMATPPPGTPDFYSAKSAWCQSDWIGPGRTMIDGLKEVKELVLKLEMGLTTYEKACSVLGEDYKELFDQQVKEFNERKEAGLPLPAWAATQELAPDAADENPDVNTNAQTA